MVNSDLHLELSYNHNPIIPLYLNFLLIKITFTKQSIFKG